MRAVVQRVSECSVRVDGKLTGSIGRGLLVLLGVQNGDTDTDLAYVANKVIGLRVFPDTKGLMNLSVLETGGAILVVSQFTLLGDVRKGKRPSFVTAAPPTIALEMYESFCECIRQAGVSVATGKFQADMQVQLTNDGPVTILVDSQKIL